MLTFDLKQIHFQTDFDNQESTTLTITSESIQGKLNIFINVYPLFVFLVYYSTNTNNSERSHIAQLSSSNGEIIK